MLINFVGATNNANRHTEPPREPCIAARMPGSRGIGGCGHAAVCHNSLLVNSIYDLMAYFSFSFQFSSTQTTRAPAPLSWLRPRCRVKRRVRSTRRSHPLIRIFLFVSPQQAPPWLRRDGKKTKFDCFDVLAQATNHLKDRCFTAHIHCGPEN